MNIVIAVVFGALAGGALAVGIVATALGTRFARGLNW